MKHFYFFFSCALLLGGANLSAQYLESFDIPNKGVLAGGLCSGTDISSCSSVDFTGVDWTMEGNFSGIDIEGFFTQNGYLLSEDLDEEVCWVSPVLIINSSGVVTVSATITIPSGTAWESSTTPGSTDYANVEYSVDGGAFQRIPNVTGCASSGFTISTAGCGVSLVGPQTFTPTATGITGGTLQIRVCFDTNAGTDDGWLEDVSVPQAGVAVLPVELASFVAVPGPKNVNLSWVTASEDGNRGFSVERSMDAVNFAPIGWVDGAGTTAAENTYTFVDEQVTGGQAYYYRLRQEDHDGTFAYSPIETARVDGAAAKGRLYPNPAANGLSTLELISTETEQREVSILDLSGRVLATSTYRLGAGVNRLPIDLSGRASGTYLVRIAGREGTDLLRLVR